MSVYRRKRVDDAALSDGPVAALADDVIEFAAQGGEIRNLSVHFREVLASNGIDSFARAVPLIGKAEQLADLRKGESEIARAANETKRSNCSGL